MRFGGHNMSEASDKLDEIIASVWSDTKLGPGQIILRLPQTTRDILKELKSDDLVAIRPDYIWGSYLNANRR